jgi:hypothetical protein
VAAAHEHLDEILCYFPLGKKHLKDLAPKYLLQIFGLQALGDSKDALAIEAAIGTEDVGVGIESQSRRGGQTIGWK